MITQRFVLDGGYPDGLWACAGCGAHLESGPDDAGTVIGHKGDCPEGRRTDNCPATTRNQPLYSLDSYGVQCKFLRGHEGDHAGYPGYAPNNGDVFWPQEPAVSPALSESTLAGGVPEDRIERIHRTSPPVVRHADHAPDLICRPAGNGLCQPLPDYRQELDGNEISGRAQPS